MKIAVSATGKTLNSQVDWRFGRCSHFLIVDSESMSFEVMTNEAVEAMGGAGIQAAQALTGRGVKTVITGNVGPNAFQTLTAAKIEIVAGASGSVYDVIQKLNSGELSATQEPTVREHSGIGQGIRRGQGRRR